MRVRILLSILTVVTLQRHILGQTALSIPGLVNSASFAPGLPRGGALGAAFVSGLTGTAGVLTAASSSPLPFELGGVRVTINGAHAPILAVFIPSAGSATPGQINFQVPSERNASLDADGSAFGGGNLTVSQSGNGQVGLSLSGTGLGAFPGGFFADANGYAIAQHASDYSQVTVQNPAHPGETIIVYGTDFYQVWPPPPIGMPVPLQPLFQFDDTIFPFLGLLFLQSYPDSPIPGKSYATTPSLKILFQGLAPGLVGVEQLNIVVLANQSPGDWALFFNIGSCAEGGVCNIVGGISSPYVLVPVR